MSCSGNPKDCAFCGTQPSPCAKDSVPGCAADVQHCEVCKGKGCVALECTGDVSTCKSCMGSFSSCRKSQVSAVEGVERVEKAPAA